MRAARHLMTRMSMWLPAALCLAGLLLCSHNPVERPTSEALDLVVMPDTTVAANDTLCLFTAATGAQGQTVSYLWSIGDTRDTTSRGILCRPWSVDDSGVNFVIVKAMTAAGAVSAPESIAVTVTVCRPAIQAVDSLLTGNDTLRVHPADTSRCNAVAYYVWSIDGAAPADTTLHSFLVKQWAPADTGSHVVAVRAVGRWGLVSAPVSIRVIVASCLPVIAAPNDTLVNGDTLRVHLVNSTGCRQAAYYLWSFDGGATFPDTTYAGVFVKQWVAADSGLRIVMVKAAGVSGLLSETVSQPVRVAFCRPSVTLAADSVAAVGDSSRLAATPVISCGGIVRFAWSFDGGATYPETTLAGTRIKQWAIGDTGLRTVGVRAVSTAGAASDPAFAAVRVVINAPTVRMQPDTTVWVNDTVVIRATAVTGNYGIGRFVWTVDAEAAGRQTAAGQLALLWPVDRAGAHVVKVQVIDGRGIASAADSMTVTVLPGAPIVRAMHDTLVSALDTLTAAFTASDPNGAIKKYLWSIGRFGWTDSTDTPEKRLWYQGVTPVTVHVGARDDDGIVSVDSFVLSFNRPPSGLVMTSPGDIEFVRIGDVASAQGIVNFAFSAIDSDGPSDTIAYRLSLGASAGSLATVYEGRQTAFTAAGLDTVRYYWQLTAHDRLGDSAVIQGTFARVFQRTICFFGHSIVAGLLGDNVNGGFRAGVLSSMREAFGGASRVKAVGSMSTPNMADKADDSSMALSGSTASTMWTLLVNSFPALDADTWVIMLGVNGGYNASTEMQPLIYIVNEIERRNPRADIYLVNGLPYPDPPVPVWNDGWYSVRPRLPVFNRMLADTAASKTLQGWRVHDVDVHSAFMATDTTRRTDLFADEIHPNQAGYDTMAAVILTSMGIAVKP